MCMQLSYCFYKLFALLAQEVFIICIIGSQCLIDQHFVCLIDQHFVCLIDQHFVCSIDQHFCTCTVCSIKSTKLSMHSLTPPPPPPPPSSPLLLPRSPGCKCANCTTDEPKASVAQAYNKGEPSTNESIT